MADVTETLFPGVNRKLYDNPDGTYSENIPFRIFTNGGDVETRIAVDIGQTGFFLGREFRTFKELDIAGSGSYVIKVVTPIDLILTGLSAIIGAGHLRMATMVGGSEGGSFSETLPIFNRNNMAERPTPLYTTQVAITAGGTHTGGTELDVIRIKANDISGQATSVGGAVGDERGIAAGTYYFRLTNLSATDAITGVLSARWEERPEQL